MTNADGSEERGEKTAPMNAEMGSGHFCNISLDWQMVQGFDVVGRYNLLYLLPAWGVAVLYGFAVVRSLRCSIAYQFPRTPHLGGWTPDHLSR
jgi:hypothetical protein